MYVYIYICFVYVVIVVEPKTFHLCSHIHCALQCTALHCTLQAHCREG